ncbi:MAG TPA: hypothetical protein DDZ42_00870 [Candidatus Rokubacteria bacterium]|nr:MAG: hypothetical protein A2050_00575 [Candidatus Rokubacteria bacterium GWA2_73_35]HBH00462.1 hypothetical protein [Candidatus Rokubacteria bacterium]
MDADRTEQGTLADLERLAREAGAVELAREAAAVAERLREGRFYVACVGQFKRGKSTLINALVGEPVLPTGVVPVTAAVTVVRFGARVAARVRFGERDWEDCDPRALATYVAEEHNPGNEKGVTGVEVFVPSPLLATGLCLVDTPGIASVSPAGTAATRAFVPHIDAALLVLGADPPISGDELGLVEEIARSAHELIVVLNKADRLGDAERAEALGFTERVLAERLRRPVAPILQVSAVERLAGGPPGRDWDALVWCLEGLALGSGASLVRAAEARETAALRDALLLELDAEREALERPLHESQARVASLRRAIAGAERALEELGPRMSAVQERLRRAFSEARDAFFRGALREARAALRARLDGVFASGGAPRARATGAAVDVARECLERWRREQEPEVERLYREGMQRFAEVLGEVHDRTAASPELARLSRPEVMTGVTARSRLVYTEMLTAAPASVGAGLLDAVRPPRARRRRIERAAAAYLERLLEANSARAKNDFLERVLESRRGLEAEVRRRLQDVAAAAERAVEQARRTQEAGAAAVQARVDAIARLRTEVEALEHPEA